MKMKKNIKWSMIYLTGTILQMGLVCGIKILLEKINISYPTACSLLFLAFGGIEEIGWRYTFQPLLEESIPYEVASLVTFLCWGTWHYMYFSCDYIRKKRAGNRIERILKNFLYNKKELSNDSSFKITKLFLLFRISNRKYIHKVFLEFRLLYILQI